jgi:hypothetical protein
MEWLSVHREFVTEVIKRPDQRKVSYGFEGTQYLRTKLYSAYSLINYLIHGDQASMETVRQLRQTLLGDARRRAVLTSGRDDREPVLSSAAQKPLDYNP